MIRALLVSLIVAACTVETDDPMPVPSTSGTMDNGPVQLTCDELVECLLDERPTCVLEQQGALDDAEMVIEICEPLLATNPANYEDCLARHCD